MSDTMTSDEADALVTDVLRGTTSSDVTDWLRQEIDVLGLALTDEQKKLQQQLDRVKKIQTAIALRTEALRAMNGGEEST